MGIQRSWPAWGATYWCTQVSPLWAALKLYFLKRSSTIWEHRHKHCWGATRQPQPLPLHKSTATHTQLGGDRVKLWKGRQRGKARKDKRGSAPPQLAKSVLWFRQVQLTAALVVLLGRERGWGIRLLELNISAHSSLWEFNGCKHSVLCMNYKVWHVSTWTFREPNSET